MALSWPKTYQVAVGLRLKALTLALLDRERTKGRKISKKAFLKEAGISDTAWANYEKGNRPTDAWECHKFKKRWGGAFEWIFGDDIESIVDPILQNAIWQHHQNLLREKEHTHAA